MCSRIGRTGLPVESCQEEKQVSLTNTVYIFHGRDSSSQGRKIKALAAVAKKCGWKVIIPDFRRIKDPDQRIARFIEKHQRPYGKVVFAGSSMGSYVAIEASRTFRPEALFLLAPAVYLKGYAQPDPRPVADHTTVIHGWDDKVVAPACAVRFADKFKTDLHLLNDQHELHDSMPFIEKTFQRLLESQTESSRLEKLAAVI